MAFFSSIPDVEEITMDDFVIKSGSPKLKGNKDGMLLIYASYCGYCTMVKPEWMRLGKAMKSMPGKVYALQGDTPKNQDLFQYMNISTVPDIRYVSASGKIDGSKFDKERTVDGFMKYYKSKSKAKPASKPAKKASKKVSKKKPAKKSAPKKKSLASKKAAVQEGGARRQKRKRRTRKPTKNVAKAKKVKRTRKKVRADKKIKVQNKKKNIKNIKL